jgi:hypothetical protein
MLPLPLALFSITKSCNASNNKREQQKDREKQVTENEATGSKHSAPVVGTRLNQHCNHNASSRSFNSQILQMVWKALAYIQCSKGKMKKESRHAMAQEHEAHIVLHSCR